MSDILRFILLRYFRLGGMGLRHTIKSALDLFCRVYWKATLKALLRLHVGRRNPDWGSLRRWRKPTRKVACCQRWLLHTGEISCSCTSELFAVATLSGHRCPMWLQVSDRAAPSWCSWPLKAVSCSSLPSPRAFKRKVNSAQGESFSEFSWRGRVRVTSGFLFFHASLFHACFLVLS